MTRPPPLSPLLTLALATGAVQLGACSSPDAGAELTVRTEDYPRAFEATKDLLVRRGFTLERIDADEGVITTRPKPTAGLATPWDHEQSALRDEWSDLMHQHERAVRVRFDPPPPPVPGAGGAEVLVSFQVDKLRVVTPGVNPAPASVRLTTTWNDPIAAERGVRRRDRVPVGSDLALANRLGDDLARRLSSSDE